MTLFFLFLLFMYISLFTIGGGLVAIPLIQQEIVGRGLISAETFYNMVAISESTPGPIVINLATYVGYELFGVVGGIVTTFGSVLPSLIIVMLIARWFSRMQENALVASAFYGLRSGATALIAISAWGVLQISVIQIPLFLQTKRIIDLCNWPSLLLFAVLFLLVQKLSWHPIVFIAIGAIFGVFFL